MACPEDVAPRHRHIPGAAAASQTYQVSGNQLTIFAASGQKLLQYVQHSRLVEAHSETSVPDSAYSHIKKEITHGNEEQAGFGWQA